MLLLSEARRRKRDRELQKQVAKFKSATPASITREDFLQRRAVWLYCEKRCGILVQNIERHMPEFERLRKVQAEIIREIPNISTGLTEFDLCPTRLEI